MKITGVVALTPSRLIATQDHQAPWSLPGLPWWFRGMATDTSVVMTREVFEGLKCKLPSNANIVLTSDTEWWDEGAICINRPEQLVGVLDLNKDVVLIGGIDIYNAFIPRMEELHTITVYDEKVSRNAAGHRLEFVEWFSDYQFVERSGVYEYGIWRRGEDDGSGVSLSSPQDRVTTIAKERPKIVHNS